MRELAKEELKDSKEQVEELEKKLKILLLTKDPNDDQNVIVEIRAGAGGEEAALFAAEIYRLYVHYAENRGWKVETLDADETVIGGMKSVEFMVKGSGAYSILKYESGVHLSLIHISGMKSCASDTAPDMHTNTDAFSTLRESYTSVEISISVLPANNL